MRLPFRERYQPGPLRHYITHPVAADPHDRCIAGSHAHPLLHCRRDAGDHLTCERHREPAQ